MLLLRFCEMLYFFTLNGFVVVVMVVLLVILLLLENAGWDADAAQDAAVVIVGAVCPIVVDAVLFFAKF